MQKQTKTVSQAINQITRLSKERVQSIKAGKRKSEPDPPPDPE